MILLGLVLSLVSAPAWSAEPIPDFTFVHASDVHAPEKASADVIAEIGKLGEIDLAPFGVTAKAPSFVVVSGDLTEFGGGNGAWDTYLNWWKAVTVPVYHTGGNHDGPWHCIRNKIRELHGADYWSFDHSGCHFIGLDTAIPQDPRAAITPEALAWMAEDLKKVNPETPVFLVIHHTLNDSYYGSPYGVDRFMDLLRPYNLIAVLAGHGHHAKLQRLDGVDTTDGGATCGPVSKKCIPGFSVVSVLDGKLRIAFKAVGEAAAKTEILEKPLPTKSSYPKIEIVSPKENEILKEGDPVVTATITGNAKPLIKAECVIDKTDFKPENTNASPMQFVKAEFDLAYYEGKTSLADLTPGAHYLRVVFTDETGETFHKSVRFNVESAEADRLLWRTFVGGACRGAPAVSGDLVYVGATDMKLYALDKATGETKWTFPAGGEIACQPLVVGDTVYFGADDGKLYSVGTDGKQKWTFAAKEAVYTSPVYANGRVLFGSNDSDFYAVYFQDGAQQWVCTEPAYTIESKPYVDGNTVYFGAWDKHLYAVDIDTGQLKWKLITHASATMPAPQYYSPADCGPVASEGKVFVADRNSELNVVDAAAGTLVRSTEDCVALGISEDRKSIYTRSPTRGKLIKLDLEGNEVWASPAALDSVPAAPVEKDGVVYVVSRLGLVQAFNASDGALLWKYQATPLLYVLSEVEVRDGVVYISGMDGSVTAIKVK
jgi:outer membrane protein assembly factor BamB